MLLRGVFQEQRGPSKVGSREGRESERQAGARLQRAHRRVSKGVAYLPNERRLALQAL